MWLLDPRGPFLHIWYPYPYSITFTNEFFCLQIWNHFNVYQVNLEMTLKKLELLAMAMVLANYKERWFRWWNMSKKSQVTYNFPRSPCSMNSLRPWMEIASYRAGIRFSCLVCIPKVFVYLTCDLTPNSFF